MVKKLSYITKFMGGSSCGGGGASSYQNLVLQMTLAPHYLVLGSLFGAVLAPPVTTLLGLVTRKDAINAGVTEKRALNFSRQCPLVGSYKCKRPGHIERFRKG